MTHEAGLLAVFQMRLGRPHQKRRNVPRILVDGLRGAVVIGHLIIGERLRHGQRFTGDEIGIVVACLRQSPCRPAALVIAGQQRMDVVRSILGILRENVEDEGRKAAFDAARLGNQREVRRCGAIVGGSSRFLVRERRREIVRGMPGRSNISPSRSVRPRSSYSAAKRLHLLFGIAEILERAEGHQIHRMTGRADFLVDLQAALQLALVVGAERAGERPVHLLAACGSDNGSARPRCALFRRSRSRQPSASEAELPPKCLKESFIQFPSFSRFASGLSRGFLAPAGAPDAAGCRLAPFFGQHRFGDRVRQTLGGVSIRPSTGMMTRKKAK